MDIMNYAQDFGYRTAHRGFLNTLIFPLEGIIAITSDPHDVQFESQKTTEIQPIFSWLIPLIVLVAGWTLRLGLGTSLGFYALEALLLAGVCKFYLQLAGWGYVLELALNFWVSFLLWSLIFLVFFAMIGIFLL